MCKECKKLLELYSSVLLECLKQKKEITRFIITKCYNCGEVIYIPITTSNNVKEIK